MKSVTTNVLRSLKEKGNGTNNLSLDILAGIKLDSNGNNTYTLFTNESVYKVGINNKIISVFVEIHDYILKSPSD